MNLTDIQKVFNDNYNFITLREEALKILKSLIEDWENNFLMEEKDFLPDKISFKDLIIEYSRTCLIINNSDRQYPYFNIRIDLLDPKDNFAIFWYDVEFNSDGKISDDYFGRY